MREAFIEQPGDLLPLAEEALRELKPQETATLLALHGELGAGKTTFTQALAKALGIADYVVSPTFVVMRRYPIPSHPRFEELFHIDAYRIETLDELEPLRFSELIVDPRNLICIEWAGKIESPVLDPAYHLTFELVDGGVRKVTYGYRDVATKEDISP